MKTWVFPRLDWMERRDPSLDPGSAGVSSVVVDVYTRLDGTYLVHTSNWGPYYSSVTTNIRKTKCDFDASESFLH